MFYILKFFNFIFYFYLFISDYFHFDSSIWFLLLTLLDFGYCSLGSSAAGSLLLSLREKLSPLLVPTSGFLMSSLLEPGVLGDLGTLSPGYCALVLWTSSSFLMDVSLTLHACCSWLLRGFWKQLLVSGGMFLELRMLATFLEDPGSVSSIHMVPSQMKLPNSSARWTDILFWSTQAMNVCGALTCRH